MVLIIGISEVANKSWDFLNEIPEKPAEVSVVGVLQGTQQGLGSWEVLCSRHWR